VSAIAAALSLIVEIIKLINRMGGVEKAMAEIKRVNDTFDGLAAAKTIEDKQNVAEDMSRLLAGDPAREPAPKP
jgi:hypothetical protein